MQEEITNLISQYLGINADVQAKLFYSLIVIIILVLLRLISNRLVSQRIEDHGALYRWRKSSGYLFWAVGIFIVGLIWLRGAGSVATYLGLVSAALVIALQDPISNFVGWVFIITRRPFGIEDRIQIGDGAAGDVIDIRFFQFSLMEIGNWVDADQSTGRILHIPNRRVFSENIANFTQGFSFLWNEIPVVFTFESDWRMGKTRLKEIARRHTLAQDLVKQQVREASNRYLIYYKNLTPIVYTKVVDHGVMLTVRYLANPRQRRVSEEVIWEEIMDVVDKEPTLEFAYPTQRLFYHPTEGPPQLKPYQTPKSGDIEVPG